MPESENRHEPEKAPPGSIPPIIVKGVESHVCVLPAKPKLAFTHDAKPVRALLKPKPESTFEQKVADEVERRLRDRGDNFVLGFLIGELLSCWWHKHHED